MKFRYGVIFTIALLVSALRLHAQTGCADSPEDPTVILALVGGAGAFFAYARGRVKARRNLTGR